MNNIRVHVCYLAVIAALLAVLGISLSRPSKVVEVVKHTTDTMKVVRIDTMTITKIIEKEKVVVDTVYITNGNDSTPVPISRYRFFKENEYDITALGFNISLPSITVFPKTITNTITNTIEKEIVANYWDFYLGAGFWHFNKEWIPNIGATVKAPQNFLFGANLGYYNKHLLVGGTIQYKITHNR